MKKWMILVLMVVLSSRGRTENIYTIDADLTEMTGNASVASNLNVGSLTLNGQSITNWSGAQSVIDMRGVVYGTDFTTNPFEESCWSFQGLTWWATNAVKMYPYAQEVSCLMYSSINAMPNGPYTLQIGMSKCFENSPGSVEVHNPDGDLVMRKNYFGRYSPVTIQWTGAWSRISILGNPKSGNPNSIAGINQFMISRDSAIEIETIFSGNINVECMMVSQTLDVDELDVSTISSVRSIASSRGDSVLAPADLSIQAGRGGEAMPSYPLHVSSGGELRLISGDGSTVYASQRGTDRAGDGGVLSLKTGDGGDIKYGTLGRAGDGGNVVIEAGSGGSGRDPEYGGAGGDVVVRPGHGGAGRIASGTSGAIYLDGATHVGGHLNMQGHVISNAAFVGDGAGLVNISMLSLSGTIGDAQVEEGSISVRALNTTNVDSRYVNRSGDSMTGSLVVGAISNLVSLDFSGSSVSVGRGAIGRADGLALGYHASGTYLGSAAGCRANASYTGVAVGHKANASYGGVAVGYNTYAARGNIAIGRSADVREGGRRIAIGDAAKNKMDETALIRGSLYLDGATGIFYRASFGEGAWQPFAGSGSSPYHVLRTGDSMIGALVVDAPETQTNLVVSGWTVLSCIPPQGGLSMGIFTNGLPQ